MWDQTALVKTAISSEENVCSFNVSYSSSVSSFRFRFMASRRDVVLPSSIGRSDSVGGGAACV
jgi:hypothetical protein